MNDTTLSEQIVSLQNNREFLPAKELIYTRLAKDFDLSKPQEVILKATLAGHLIDVGDESKDEKAVHDGQQIFEQERSIFCQYLKESSIEYNLGNAQYALYKIYRSQPNFTFKPETIRILTEAKNHYWKSYKLLSDDDTQLYPQLLTNLALSLSQSGRVAESLHYYDAVLSLFPTFPQANANRAEDLLWLSRLSGSYTVNLLYQAMKGFEYSLQDSHIPGWVQNIWSQKYDALQQELQKIGYTEADEEHDHNETQREADSHSAYRKFCLVHHLCLSEHSLYCNCIGAQNDDLAIPLTSGGISGKFIPQMELILNRLKSEFSLARVLFYQVETMSEEDFSPFDQDVLYTELFDHEEISTHAEMLRTSYRICFGILDKIAYGICRLFSLAKPSENVSFESFWRPPKKRERWEKINTIDNFPLIALYSQATDLNVCFGEWGMFKEWRNALEHELLCLIINEGNQQDPYGMFGNDTLFKRIPYDYFKTKTLHLLQLTRSAIFNFVFCVRHEGRKNDNGKIPLPLTLGFKR